MRAVLFDAVGTLIHLREPVGETYARVAAVHGVRVAPAALQSAFGRVMRQQPPMVFPGQPRAAVREAERAWWRALVASVFGAADAAARFADFDAFFTPLFAHYGGAGAWRCAPGAIDVLGALRRRGLRTGMVSNFDFRLPSVLAALGLGALLEVVVRPADAGAAKPDPRIFALALARLDVAASAAVYVGDDADDDVAGARNAGLRAIDVASLRDLRELDAMVSP